MVFFLIGVGAYYGNAAESDACTTGTYGNWSTIYDTPDCNAAWEATHDAERVMALSCLFALGLPLALYAGRNKPGQLGDRWLSTTTPTTAEPGGATTKPSTCRRGIDGALMGLAGVLGIIGTARDAYELTSFSVTIRSLVGLLIVAYGAYIVATRRPYIITRWIYVLPVGLVICAFL